MAKWFLSNKASEFFGAFVNIDYEIAQKDNDFVEVPVENATFKIAQDYLSEHSQGVRYEMFKEGYDVALHNYDSELFLDIMESMNKHNDVAQLSETDKERYEKIKTPKFHLRDFIPQSAIAVNWVNRYIDSKLVHDDAFMLKAIRDEKYDFLDKVEKHNDSYATSVADDNIEVMKGKIKTYSTALLDKLDTDSSDTKIKSVLDCVQSFYVGYQKEGKTLSECQDLFLEHHGDRLYVNHYFGDEAKPGLNQAAFKSIARRFFNGADNLAMKTFEHTQEFNILNNESPYAKTVRDSLTLLSNSDKPENQEKYNKVFDKIDSEIAVSNDIRSITFYSHLLSRDMMRTKRFHDMLELQPERVNGLVESISKFRALENYEGFLHKYESQWSNNKEAMWSLLSNRIIRNDFDSPLSQKIFQEADKFDFSKEINDLAHSNNLFLRDVKKSSRSYSGMDFKEGLFNWCVAHGLDVNKEKENAKITSLDLIPTDTKKDDFDFSVKNTQVSNSVQELKELEKGVSKTQVFTYLTETADKAESKANALANKNSEQYLGSVSQQFIGSTSDKAVEALKKVEEVNPATVPSNWNKFLDRALLLDNEKGALAAIEKGAKWDRNSLLSNPYLEKRLIDKFGSKEEGLAKLDKFIAVMEVRTGKQLFATSEPKKHDFLKKEDEVEQKQSSFKM